MKNSLSLLVLGFVLLSGCSTVSDITDTVSGANNDVAETNARVANANAQVSQGVMVGDAMMLASRNLVQNASQANNLTTLVSAVEAAGLAGTLSGDGPFTVFAPPNSAFDRLAEGTLAMLTEPQNKDQLASILTYHVVPGRLMAADLRDGQVLTTVNGATLLVSKRGSTLMVGGATITQGDVASSNGVAHVINKVLMPND